jgi:hypothetical protein
MKTYAPSDTNRFAVAKPMPLPPPVMTATFPSSLFPILLFCYQVGILFRKLKTKIVDIKKYEIQI